MSDTTSRSRPGLLGRLRGLFGGAPEAGAPTEDPRGVARLVVGLGNPGPDYEDTRHNMGWHVVDHLAGTLGAAFDHEKAHAQIALAEHEGVRIALAKPMTFMNRSGQAVTALLKRFGLEPDDALIVYDDLALPLGAVRLRGKGGAGGHNGVQDIINRLNSPDFPRLRVGVGDSFPPGGQVDFVLSPFDEDEREAARETAAYAAEAALGFVHDGLTAAMNRFNRR